MNRRHFLASASAIAILPAAPGLAGQDAYRLRAEAVTQQLLPDGEPATAMLGFNGSMPGPELRLRRGERVTIDVENGLDDGTAVHWHGIRLANRMDGVPFLTQELINPGDTMAYSFVPPDAGTFWYHSHYISHEQVARGMIGPLIVEDDTPPDVDHDITVVISDWQMEKDGSLVDNYTDRHSVSHEGYIGNFVRAFVSRSQVAVGDRVRLRLINAATNRVIPMKISGVSGKIVALDGMALKEPRSMKTLELAPAQRADLIVDITGPVSFDMVTRLKRRHKLAELATDGTNTSRVAAPIPTLAAPEVPTPAEPTQHLTLTMMGGGMSMMMGGGSGGDDVWAFNNISGLGEEPFGSFSRGETIRITMENDTSFPHGIHLHGHHFYEVNEDGTLGDLRDTTLIEARKSRDVICVFDNPGRWLLHCHMLSHALAGMRTWVNVA